MTVTIIQADLEQDHPRQHAARVRGRRAGSITKFPGLVVFSRKVDRTPTHLFRVLMGERPSRVLVNGYAAFLRERGIAWPSAAKVKPQAA